MLGATGAQYWRMVALPILFPSLLGTFALLFANAFGAVATAYRAHRVVAQHRADPALRADPRRRARQPAPRLRAGLRHDRHHRRRQRALHLAARPLREVAEVKRFWRLGGLPVGLLYFILPLVGMTEFSLSMRRGVYSLDAYAPVLADPQFQETFSYSVVMALFTIVFGVLLVVPTAYWVRLQAAGAAALSSSSSRCCRWSSRPSSSSSATSGSTTPRAGCR